MKLHHYANGGSANHGCEAIYRSLIGLLPDYQHIIHSLSPSEDSFYGLESMASLLPLEQPVSLTGLNNILYKLQLKWHKNDQPYFDKAYKSFLEYASSDDIYLSVGGDNYCYSSYDWLEYLNRKLTAKGCRTILAGCSIEPHSLTPRLINDLNRYSLIIARESLTYNALIDSRLKNVVLLPDPAFTLATNSVTLPCNMTQGNTVGINISPTISAYESHKNSAFENYKELINYILRYTDMTVLLVPHVVKKNSDDRIPLNELYRDFEKSGRIALVEDSNCYELKGYISQCRFFVAARTHSSIAAYSTCVPTLVVGYSIKAKGIAADIFEEYSDLVLPVQSLSHSKKLVECFKKLLDREAEIKKHLSTFMP